MARTAVTSRRWRAPRAGLGGALLFALAAAAPPAQAAIYSCVDASGNRRTSDRPIAECRHREQRVLNADGSVREVVPPQMTADERADAEAAERRAVQERAARLDAMRRDRNLVIRFPNEAAHRRAREAALVDLRKAVESSEQRLEALARERKPLQDETEFYKGRPLPPRLQQALDANDAGVEAQRALVQNQQAEAARINGLFDQELARLRRLWAGAPPGSLGAMPPSVAAQTAAAAISASAARR